MAWLFELDNFSGIWQSMMESGDEFVDYDSDDDECGEIEENGMEYFEKHCKACIKDGAVCVYLTDSKYKKLLSIMKTTKKTAE